MASTNVSGGGDADRPRRKSSRSSKKKGKPAKAKYYREYKALYLREIKERYVAKVHRDIHCGLAGVTLDDSDSIYRIFEHNGGRYVLPEAEIKDEILDQMRSEVEIAAKGLHFTCDNGWQRREWIEETEDDEEDSDSLNEEEETEDSYEEEIEEDEDESDESSIIEHSIVGQDITSLFLCQLSNGIAKFHMLNLLKELGSIVKSKLHIYFSGSSNSTDPLAKPLIMNDPGQVKRRRTSSVPSSPSSSDYSSKPKRKRRSGNTSELSDSGAKVGRPPRSVIHKVSDLIVFYPIEKLPEPHMHACLIVKIKGLEKGKNPDIKAAECYQLYEEAVSYLNRQTIVFGAVIKVGSAKLFSLQKTPTKVLVTQIGSYQFQDEAGNCASQECLKFLRNIASVLAEFQNLFPEACQICHPPK